MSRFYQPLVPDINCKLHHREQEQLELEKQKAAYFAKGGKVEVVPSGVQKEAMTLSQKQIMNGLARSKAL